MPPRFRKSKPPADIPVSIPAPPVHLVENLGSRKDSRTLAALSAAIALSIGSASHNISETSSDNATVQEKDTGWRTAYGAAKMTVELTKESSDMFLPLKAVASAISVLIKNYDQTSDNAEMVKGIERRVQSLSGVLASPASQDDDAEKVRRMELRGRLEGIIAKLEPLIEQDTLVRFLRNVENAKMLTGFIQELIDAVANYQLSVQQGVYERTRNICDDTRNIRDDTKNIRNDTNDIHNDTKNIRGDARHTRETADLEKLEPVRNAGYQADHHDKCLPGTRESVLEEIMGWVRNPQDRNVFWLNGLAGTGKSTIAQSFSEMVANEGILGASFFCSRDYLDRRQLKNIFPTLAYQLACHYPHFRSYIVTSIKEDPIIAHTSLISQLKNLLVDPLSDKNISCVIVIDALDECIDDQPASAILSVLGQFVKQIPLVKFFITGRPEPQIRTGFRLPLLEPLTQMFLLHQVESCSVDNDIQLYLAQKLTMISKQRSDLNLPNPWPHDHEISALTRKSSGLFIFASTLVRFIASEHHEPESRLQLVLSETSGTMHEGHAGIDSLYSQVLLHAFSNVKETEVFDNIRRVLGAIVLAFNPLSRRELSTILRIPVALISTTLRHLHSVILIPIDEVEGIHVFHKSFPDFLQDNQRCTDPRFYLDPMTYHGGMVISCLGLVTKLERNPCSLPLLTINQDTLNLPQLLENKLGGGVRYACSYWARHLGLSPTSGDYIDQVTVLMVAMLENIPPWIEVMSLENCLEDVIHSMYGLLGWLENVIARINTDAYVTEAYAKAEAKGHVQTETEVYATAYARTDSIGRAKAYTMSYIESKGKFYAEAEAEALMALHGLATDCLRLSMHFFNPIQQSAHQIYHTALPLSPTSSPLYISHLQSIMDNQLSHVAAFLGAPGTWGLLLRTIDVRPMQLTCIATSLQRIVAGCVGDVVNIYDAVTGVLRQFLCTPGRVTKIQDSPDGSILFFSHYSSVTMWDVQTGGLVHTFTTQSKVNDIATSATHIACGLANGSVSFWNFHTKEEGKDFGDGQAVVTIYWLSAEELAVAAQNTLYIYNIAIGEILGRLSISGCVWGLVYLEDKGEFLVGTSHPGSRAGQEECFFIRCQQRRLNPWELGVLCWKFEILELSLAHRGQLSNPTLVGEEIVCITLTNGVQLFNIDSYRWTNSPPPLAAATSVAVSLNRNIVVQTKDSIQIFSIDVVTSSEVLDDTPLSHIYPLGKNYILSVLQPDRHLTLLDLETLQELYPGDNSLSPRSSLVNQSPPASTLFRHGSAIAVIRAWESGAPLPRWAVAVDADEDALLSGFSPKRARVVTVYSLPRPELRVKDTRRGIMLASLPLEHNGMGSMGKLEAYDLIFDSETRFYLKMHGPGQHVQIPYDIVAPSSGHYSHTLTVGKPEPLSEAWEIPPYTLDANCEWVLDAESRKVCWISPGNVRRGNGGHFWAGLSLVMIGNDGVVRKLTFKEPDC